MASGLDAFFFWRLSRGFYHSVCVLVTHVGGFVNRVCLTGCNSSSTTKILSSEVLGVGRVRAQPRYLDIGPCWCCASKQEPWICPIQSCTSSSLCVNEHLIIEIAWNLPDKADRVVDDLACPQWLEVWLGTGTHISEYRNSE